MIRRIGALGVASLVFVVVAGASCGGGGAGPDGGFPGTAGTKASSAGTAGTTGSQGTAGVTGTAGATGTAGTRASTGAAGTTVAPAGSPVALCRELVTTLCTRLNQCEGLDASAQDTADCVTLENVEFGCDLATSAGFPTCLNDVKVLSCAALFTAQGLAAPASCDEPLNTIPLSVAQMKCAALGHTICQKFFMCDGVTPTAADLAACDQEAFFEIQCNYAVDVGPTYDQCLTDFPKSTCPPPPDAGTDAGGGAVPSCVGVIKGPL